MKKTRQGLVYSTETGKLCPGCGQPPKQCSCKKAQVVPNDGVVRISRQTKGRKGAGVSLISGVPLAEAELKVLAKNLKQKCGTGGTIKNGVIEIQGDHRELLRELLQQAGYTVKLAGG
ncbi:translation initiation factor Sui1 [Desulfopila aestuarii]|uniref:Translation initiation factor 1 (eIF-1/SUI1) n=1 Tax=Desulfopila aestuarii DSM 18488 TaxID=1121416 RepID=A0A1M7YHZ3_9BACT|nr:translation initiation factor Sui1 [Desulfopila aestuarii]SHO52223.1 translation initiation factor 1 (eIF-1/SUI1) [Desulfopila aestuarii DSM 18488]